MLLLELLATVIIKPQGRFLGLAVTVIFQPLRQVFGATKKIFFVVFKLLRQFCGAIRDGFLELLGRSGSYLKRSLLSR